MRHGPHACKNTYISSEYGEMSVERVTYETQPDINVVSDDIVLPLTKSSVLSRTKDRYDGMESHQKRDFWAAVGATMGGVALTTAAFALEKRNPSSRLPIMLRGAGYALDYADGYFAKRSATAVDDGAATELGAIADPLADKYNNTLNEISLVGQDRLSSTHVIIRSARDIGITATRRFVTQRTNGRVDVKANKLGKWNTAVRDGVNLFSSTHYADEHPKVRGALHVAATAYSVVSALYTVKQLKAAYHDRAAPQKKQ